MNKLFNNFTFILAFMVFMVFWNMIFGKKSTETLLWLILLGMVLTNSNQLSNMLKSGVSTIKQGADQKGILNTPQTGGNSQRYYA